MVHVSVLIIRVDRVDKYFYRHYCASKIKWATGKHNAGIYFLLLCDCFTSVRGRMVLIVA